MRHRYHLLCLFLLLGLPIAAWAQQPFEQFGIKVKILSLSNGRYPEYYPNDSLRRMGSVVYDTRLKRVAYLLPGDSLLGRVQSDVVSRWWVVDPLAEKYAHISPYTYVSNNPIRLSDPDGRSENDVILKGNKAAEALKQLQSAVQGQLTLSMDKNGKVAYTAVAGATQSKESGQLTKAIDDHSVTVNVRATDSKLTSKGGVNPGGSFFGNTVTRQPGGASNKVSTQQEVHVPSSGAMDAYYNKPGATILHEVVESYLGGQMSKQTGVSSKPGSDKIGGSFPSVYQAAHDKAPTQAGNIYQSLYDQNNQPYTAAPGQTLQKIEYFVQDGNRPPAVIFSYP